MKLGGEPYSPAVLQKIEYAGGNGRSFQSAAASLQRLAELQVNPKQVERVTGRLGKERADARDKSAAAMEARRLRSQYKQPPAVVMISVDAGKAQFRQEGKGPGVHTPRWGDTKVACLHEGCVPADLRGCLARLRPAAAAAQGVSRSRTGRTAVPGDGPRRRERRRQAKQTGR